MSNLMDVGIEAIAIQDALIEAQGELTPELESKLDALLANGAAALDSAAWVVRKLTADAEACKEESLRYENRAKSFMGQVDFLKGRMLFALDAAFNGKLKTEIRDYIRETRRIKIKKMKIDENNKKGYDDLYIKS